MFLEKDPPGGRSSDGDAEDRKKARALMEGPDQQSRPEARGVCAEQREIAKVGNPK